VSVQLKAVVENGPLYMVFYYLTRPPFAVKVGETLRCETRTWSSIFERTPQHRSTGTSLV